MDFEQNVRLNFDLLSDNEKDMVFFIRTHKAQVENNYCLLKVLSYV